MTLTAFSGIKPERSGRSVSARTYATDCDLSWVVRTGKSAQSPLRLNATKCMLEPKENALRGTIKSLNRTGHGIIQADDGSKVPFLFTDVLSHKVFALGQRVIFSVRRVQGNVFAENISYEANRTGNQ